MSAEATGRQLVTVWKCPVCGWVSRDEWFAGSHVRLGASEQSDRCTGKPKRGYWLSDDEYLDWIIDARKGTTA